MRRTGLLLALIWAATTSADPISPQSFINCKNLQALKTLNLQQLTGNWLPKKVYALSEETADIGEQVAKPNGKRCILQEIFGVNGMALQVSVVDTKTDTRNTSSCTVNRYEHGMWTCSPIGKGPFDVEVLMAEPNSYMLVASACVAARNIPGLEQFGVEKFAVALWLFQKRDVPELGADKIALVDQRAQQVLQRWPVQREIQCDRRGGHGGGQGGGQGGGKGGGHGGGQGGGHGGGRPGGFDNRPPTNRPGVVFPPDNGAHHPDNNPNGGSTVLKPGVTYVKPGAGAQTGKPGTKLHSNPVVNQLLHDINEWFRDPRNKKQPGRGHSGGQGGQGEEGFSEGGFGDYGDFGAEGGNNGLGFRLGGGNNPQGAPNATATTVAANATQATETDNEALEQ